MCFKLEYIGDGRIDVFILWLVFILRNRVDKIKWSNTSKVPNLTMVRSLETLIIMLILIKQWIFSSFSSSLFCLSLAKRLHLIEGPFLNQQCLSVESLC